MSLPATFLKTVFHATQRLKEVLNLATMQPEFNDIVTFELAELVQDPTLMHRVRLMKSNGDATNLDVSIRQIDPQNKHTRIKFAKFFPEDGANYSYSDVTEQVYMALNRRLLATIDEFTFAPSAPTEKQMKEALSIVEISKALLGKIIPESEVVEEMIHHIASQYQDRLIRLIRYLRKDPTKAYKKVKERLENSNLHLGPVVIYLLLRSMGVIAGMEKVFVRNTLIAKVLDVVCFYLIERSPFLDSNPDYQHEILRFSNSQISSDLISSIVEDIKKVHRQKVLKQTGSELAAGKTVHSSTKEIEPLTHHTILEMFVSCLREVFNTLAPSEKLDIKGNPYQCSIELPDEEVQVELFPDVKTGAKGRTPKIKKPEKPKAIKRSASSEERRAYNVAVANWRRACRTVDQNREKLSLPPIDDNNNLVKKNGRSPLWVNTPASFSTNRYIYFPNQPHATAFDSTSIDSENLSIPEVQHGVKSNQKKVTRNVIRLGVGVSLATGTAVSASFIEGNYTDQVTMEKVLQLSSDPKVPLLFDKGYSRRFNILLLLVEGRDFFMMREANTTIEKELKERAVKQILESPSKHLDVMRSVYAASISVSPLEIGLCDKQGRLINTQTKKPEPGVDFRLPRDLVEKKCLRYFVFLNLDRIDECLQSQKLDLVNYIRELNEGTQSFDPSKPESKFVEADEYGVFHIKFEKLDEKVFQDNVECAITNLGEDRLEDCLAFYRLRWQNELFFKAMKNEFGDLEALFKENPLTAAVHIGCLLIATSVTRVMQMFTNDLKYRKNSNATAGKHLSMIKNQRRLSMFINRPVLSTGSDGQKKITGMDKYFHAARETSRVQEFDANFVTALTQKLSRD